MNRDHAIVLGGSMAGLLAARVLTSHFRRVTLIERDSLPAGAHQRRGVPQGHHTHGLLASGRQVLETLFPGLGAELIASGAVEGDIVRDARWFHAGGCLARPASGLHGLLLSRPLIESAVRARARSIANLRFIENAAAATLTSTPGGATVTGVRLEDGREINADLIVDATGRGSKSPEWLTALGYDAPAVEQVEVALAYTTRLFRRTPDQLAGDIAAVIPPTPQGKRGGVILAQEGDRWTVTLISHFGTAAPLDIEGFRDFAATLPASFIHEVVSAAEPIGEPRSARFPASIRRRYERLSRFPEGYLVTGDAVCSFNPIYGQGMSVAALEAQALDSCLRTHAPALSRRFFRAAARIVDIPWSIAAGNDLRMPEAVGPRNPAINLINWYMEKLHRAAHADPVLSLAFHRVANLLAPPPSVFHPRNVWRVLRLAVRPATAFAPAPYRQDVSFIGNSSPRALPLSMPSIRANTPPETLR